jgi:hypothetical protein
LNIAANRASLVRRAASARRGPVMLRAILEAPMIVPARLKIGEILGAT